MIEDKDITLGRVVRFSKDYTKFSDCAIAKIAADSVTLIRPYYSSATETVCSEKFVVMRDRLKSDFFLVD